MAATLTEPTHPYTMGLRNAFPDLAGAAGQLTPIEGAPPNLMYPPPGCRFAPRCPFAKSLCTASDPQPVDVGNGHIAACHRWAEASMLRKLSDRPETWTPAP
jgi:peptide/nickel transport system ATP-binding protein